MDRGDLLPVSVFARLAGVRRQTIYNRLEKDLAPYTRSTTEGKRVQAAALVDIFGLNLGEIQSLSDRTKDNDSETEHASQGNITDLRARIAEQALQLEEQRAVISTLTAQIDSLQSQADKYQAERGQLFTQLTTVETALAETTKALAATTQALEVSQETTRTAQALHAGTLSSLQPGDDQKQRAPWWKWWRNK